MRCQGGCTDQGKNLAKSPENEHPCAGQLTCSHPNPAPSPCLPDRLLSCAPAPGNAHSSAAQILPAHLPAAVASKRHPHCPPGPDSLSQSGCTNHPLEQQRVSPCTSCDSLLPRACAHGPIPQMPPQHPPAVASCWATRALRWDARAQHTARERDRGQGDVLPQELAHPDGEEAGAKQPSGKSQQDPTRPA